MELKILSGKKVPSERFQKHNPTITFMPSNSVESTPCSPSKPPPVCLELQYLQIISLLQGPFIMEIGEIWNFEKKSVLEFYAWEWQQSKGHGSLWSSPDSAVWLHNSPRVTCILCIYKMGSMTFNEKILTIFNYVSVTDRTHGTRIISCSCLLFHCPLDRNVNLKT